MKTCLRLLFLVAGLAHAAPSAGAPAAEPPGVIIDRSADFARVYVGCPGIAILPNGRYVASHSWFGPGTQNDTSEVFGSSDRGQTWNHLATLKGQWWSNLFVHGGALYILGVTHEYGRIVIRRSTDGGATWSVPKDAQSGLLTATPGYHCAPMPVALHSGRLWRAFELAGDFSGEVVPPAPPAKNGGGSKPARPGDVRINPRIAWPSLVISAPADADLLRADQWRMSRPLPHPESKSQWIEGNVLVSPQGRLVNVLRTNPQAEQTKLHRSSGQVAIVHIDEDGLTLRHDPARDLVNFPGGGAKFTIRYDEPSRRYWSVANDQRDPAAYRNIVALASSADLTHWRVDRILLQHADSRQHAWQYLDWVFDGADIVAVSRTAWDGARSAHDANYLTFHRIAGFRTAIGTEVRPQ